MVTKKSCIELFNNIIRGTPVSFNDVVIPICSEYLTENNVENSEKIISLIINNPNSAQRLLPEVIKYYCTKYNIFILHNDKKILMYYE